MTNILYVHYGDEWIRGSEKCIIDLMQNLDSSQYTPILWTNNSQLHSQATNIGIQSECSDFKVLFGWKDQRASFSQFCSLVWQARDIIKKQQIQFIHVNSGAPCQWMWLAARICKIPMLTQLHSDYPLRDRARLCLHLSPHIVTVSKAISNNLVSEGFPSQRLDVVHNGINVESLINQSIINTKKTLNIPDNSYLIACVGSLIYRKGVDRIIRALASLTDEYPNIHLLVIGDGSEKSALMALATQCSIANHVHFVGEQQEVCSWLRGGVDLFISGARQEAFGLVIAEAAISNLPIIAPNIDGIPEIVEHLESSLLYDNHKPTQISDHIKTIIHSPSLAKHLAHTARQSVLKRFTLNINTRQLECLYQEQIKLQSQNKKSPRLLSCLTPLKGLSISHMNN